MKLRYNNIRQIFSKCLEKIIKITSGSNLKTANFVDDLYRKNETIKICKSH